VGINLSCDQGSPWKIGSKGRFVSPFQAGLSFASGDDGLPQKGEEESKLIESFEEMNRKVPNRIPPHVMGFLKAEDKVGYLIDIYKREVVEERFRECAKDSDWSIVFWNGQDFFSTNLEHNVENIFKNQIIQ
jgi:hypothetical protein